MRLKQWLKGLLDGERDEPPLPDDVFTERVAIEQARIGAHRSGVLFIEANTLTEHLTTAAFPAARDLVDLRAVTLILLDKYDYRPLQPLRQAATHAAVRDAFIEHFFAANLEGAAWSEHLIGGTGALHQHEMETMPRQWLMEWKPYDTRLNAAKSTLLQTAKLSTLTELLLILAEREEALLEGGSEVQAGPDYGQDELWHSVTDTRAMRLLVSDLWGAHPQVPRDYADAVMEQPPARQLAFLAEKKTIIAAICQGLETQAAKTTVKTENPATFSLYGD